MLIKIEKLTDKDREFFLRKMFKREITLQVDI